jgi:cupin fold WbuC family metalloprotein
VAPHRHKGKSETFLILEGFAEALMFDAQGAHTDAIPMGPAGSGRSFFYRMPPAQYHSLHIESDVLVFVESTKGPFRAEDSENAPWAPPPADVAAGRAFISGLLAA